MQGEGSGKLRRSRENYTLDTLSARTSCWCPGGRRTLHYWYPRPRMLIFRADGQTLTLAQVKALYFTVKLQVPPFQLTRHPLRRLDVETFRVAWLTLHPDQNFPVATGCGFCDSQQEHLARPMTACAKCQVMRYCDRHCLEMHQPVHSPVCVRE